MKRFFSRKKGAAGQEILQPVRIEMINAPTTITKGENLVITVSGHFSNLGWNLAEATAKIHKNEILLRVIGSRKSGMVSAQALKPFNAVIEVKGLKKGEYIIKAEKGTSNTILLKVE